MDSFELNKIIGAVLGTLLFVMGVGFLAEAIYHPIENRGPGYALPEPEVAAAGAAVEEAPAVPLAVLLTTASVDRGASAVRKCQSCHTFGEGEANKQGPNLYGIVGNAQAHLDNFAYSDIFVQHHEEGRTWTYEDLDAFLTNPKGYSPGTKMAFAGVRSPEERADILAYLQTLSASPVPFPAPEAAAAPAEGEAAPAAEGTAVEDAPAGEVAPTEVTAPASETTQAPAAVTDTPTTTQTETNVQGTPTTSGTAPAPAPATSPAAPAAPANQ
ncbi:cytochrome c [Devosia lucknowensis]|uniref:Cytochrome c n=1 Tax=Devosia lucknowensis TaxID=1096929 RepID=A0A1Y6EE21_9HYPH|nr:cytochrome c family protein [Devosia lucknowensis]SMQ58423.1 cytochrome c [Devosia lucknowensis]